MALRSSAVKTGRNLTRGVGVMKAIGPSLTPGLPWAEKYDWSSFSMKNFIIQRATRLKFYKSERNAKVAKGEVDSAEVKLIIPPLHIKRKKSSTQVIP